MLPASPSSTILRCCKNQTLFTLGLMSSVIFRFGFLHFLLFWFLVIPDGRKKLAVGVSFRFRYGPEPVHEVKIETERKQGIYSVAD